MHGLNHLFKSKNHKYCNGTMKMLLWLALVQMRFTSLPVILKTSFTSLKTFINTKKKTSRTLLKITRKSRHREKSHFW